MCSETLYMGRFLNNNFASNCLCLCFIVNYDSNGRDLLQANKDKLLYLVTQLNLNIIEWRFPATCHYQLCCAIKQTYYLYPKKPHVLSFIINGQMLCMPQYGSIREYLIRKHAVNPITFVVFRAKIVDRKWL